VTPCVPGIHFYGETVSKTMSSNEILGDFLDIFIQASLGNLPKSSPQEIQQLLNERFQRFQPLEEPSLVAYTEAYNKLTNPNPNSNSILNNVECQLPQPTVPTLEDNPEQHVRHELKRQRVDSDLLY